MRNPSFAVKLIAAAASVLMALVFVPVSSAEEVDFDGISKHAVGISDLELFGTLYNVDFITTTGKGLYGDIPGEFTFTNVYTATYAVQAVNDALNQAGAETVGPAGASENPVWPDHWLETYFVGFEVEADNDLLTHRGSIAWSNPPEWEDGGATGSYEATRTFARFDVSSAGTPRTIGGTVQGLEGSGLVLQNNGADDLNVNSNGPFAFNTPLLPGDPYEVTVAVQPSSPDQECFVVRGSDTVPEADVTNVFVYCTASEPLPEVRVFVTPTGYTGDLGGLDGADAICQVQGALADLGGSWTWTAWLSDDTENAIDRIPNGTYRLLDEAAGNPFPTLVALDKDDLTTSDGVNYLRNAIDTDQFGTQTIADVWTGTNEDGTGTATNCSNWTVATDNPNCSGSDGGEPDCGIKGLAEDQVKTSLWTRADPSGSCQGTNALYCFGIPATNTAFLPAINLLLLGTP